MPPNSAPGTVGANEHVVLAALPPFIECVPANITWTGGIAPYSLRVTLADGSSVLRGFDGINATNFVWTPDVPAGTNVSLELIDARTPVFVFTQDLITIAAGPDGASCGAPSTSVQQVAATSIIASSVASTTRTQAPTSLPSMQVVPRNKAVSGSTVAVAVAGVVIVLLLLVSFLLWRSRVTARRREHRNDTEKQEVVNERPDGDSEELRTGRDTGSMGGHSIRPSGPPASPPTNPFEDPESVSYTSPVSGPDDQIPTPAQYSFVGALPSSPRPAANMFAPIPPGRRRPKVTPRSRSRPPSVSAQSDADTRTLSDADWDAARLSVSTSSTLPPSYRTRRSAGSIYIPPPDYPPFPPPVYTPQPTGAPPSAFTFRTPRRVPPRRRPAPTPPKVSKSQGARSTSGEWESSRADGVRRESIRDTDRVEGSGTDETDADAASDPFSDGRRGSLDSPGIEAIPNRVEDVGDAAKAIPTAERTH
ncbi:hypothetical protein V8D89_014353 [Ganoderma adspersum]